MKRSIPKSRTRVLPALIFTCEHASNRIPTSLRNHFIGHSNLLNSHRAWDEGALNVAKYLAKRLNAPLIKGNFSRLAIDLNRSLHHQKSFSDIILAAPQPFRKKLIKQLYIPFRQGTLKKIISALNAGKTVHHFSIHSFTPVLNNRVRKCEIGILYDPKRPNEKRIARKLKQELSLQFPSVRIRMNYPYRGIANGHTTDLRKSFSDLKYSGIEIEFNQSWLITLRRTKNNHQKHFSGVAKAIKIATESN